MCSVAPCRNFPVVICCSFEDGFEVQNKYGKKKTVPTRSAWPGAATCRQRRVARTVDNRGSRVICVATGKLSKQHDFAMIKHSLAEYQTIRAISVMAAILATAVLKQSTVIGERWTEKRRPEARMHRTLTPLTTLRRA